MASARTREPGEALGGCSWSLYEICGVAAPRGRYRATFSISRADRRVVALPPRRNERWRTPASTDGAAFSAGYESDGPGRGSSWSVPGAPGTVAAAIGPLSSPLPLWS